MCSTYVASTTTPTPEGATASLIANAICLVNLSCTENNNAVLSDEKLNTLKNDTSSVHC